MWSYSTSFRRLVIVNVAQGHVKNQDRFRVGNSLDGSFLSTFRSKGSFCAIAVHDANSSFLFLVTFDVRLGVSRDRSLFFYGYEGEGASRSLAFTSRRPRFCGQAKGGVTTVVRLGHCQRVREDLDEDLSMDRRTSLRIVGPMGVVQVEDLRVNEQRLLRYQVVAFKGFDLRLRPSNLNCDRRQLASHCVVTNFRRAKLRVSTRQ